MYDAIRLHVARSYTSSAYSPFSLISSVTLSNHPLFSSHAHRHVYHFNLPSWTFFVISSTFDVSLILSYLVSSWVLHAVDYSVRWGNTAGGSRFRQATRSSGSLHISLNDIPLLIILRFQPMSCCPLSKPTDLYLTNRQHRVIRSNVVCNSPVYQCWPYAWCNALATIFCSRYFQMPRLM